MKIIIIGCGISGCTAYLQLKKHVPRASEQEIKIYEAYDTNINTTDEDRDGQLHSSTLIVGGGLGLFPNGLNVLKRLDESGGTLRDIVSGGYAIAHQDLKTKNGSLLARMDCTAYVPANRPGQDKMHMLATSRHSLWRALRRRIPDRDILKRRVSKVVASENGMNEVYFADDAPPVRADLVIGADGVKGVTKLALFPGQEEIYRPEYQGLVGVGGFISTEEVKGLVEKGTMSLLFGGNGFFGYFFSNSSLSTPDQDSPYHVSELGESLGWWSTYTADECPDPKTLDMDAVANQLRERHATWKDPSVYPTWTSPQLPTWESDGVVLVGDAAHALPSSSGQGSSQALEDVEAFAMLLAHELRCKYQDGDDFPDIMSYKRAIATAARGYMEIRRPRVQMILGNAQRMQNNKREMGVIVEYMLYIVLWIFGCFPAIMARSLKSVIEYDISEEIQEFTERQT
ncbi:hypothetical protein BDV18DRAFT_164154 [Aspergillus unguis]